MIGANSESVFYWQVGRAFRINRFRILIHHHCLDTHTGRSIETVNPGGSTPNECSAVMPRFRLHHINPSKEPNTSISTSDNCNNTKTATLFCEHTLKKDYTGMHKATKAAPTKPTHGNEGKGGSLDMFKRTLCLTSCSQ
jgi:hypothetical protein